MKTVLPFKEKLIAGFHIAATLIIVVLSVVIVNRLTLPIIERQKAHLQEQLKVQNEALGRIKQVLPDVDRCDKLGAWTVHDETADYYCVKTRSAVNGYVIQSFGAGYGGHIGVLIAVDPAGALLKVAVTSQSETPGLGDRVTGNDFLSQFTGKKIENMRISTATGDGGIDAITASTISSRAVTEDAVKNALLCLQKKGLIPK